jgi:release factor glutamine methyltransferase
MEPTSLGRQKVRALIAEGEYALAAGPHPERARRDAEALLLHLFKRNDPERNTAWLLAHWNNPTGHGAEFRALIKRRFSGEPIQYITGETEFYGLPFRVTPDVLIPRPETEHLVEKVLELAGGFMQPRIVDVGTGSGAIAVALAHKLAQARITAVDISAAALDVARENAERNGVTGRIDFRKSDLLAEVASERFEMVVSNPPYVPVADRASLPAEVREHEPAVALYGGEGGLDVCRRLIPAAFAVLETGGFLVMEIGYGQSEAVAVLMSEARFDQIEFVPDLQGIPRVACGRRRLASST